MTRSNRPSRVSPYAAYNPLAGPSNFVAALKYFFRLFRSDLMPPDVEDVVIVPLEC
jgi:hypothetical protein